MNFAPLYRPIACRFVAALFLTSTALATDAPPADNVAALKARLSQAEDKLEMVLHSYTLTTQGNDALKAQVAQAAAARDAAIADAATATARVKEVQAALEQTNNELAALRNSAAARDAEIARLRTILRQTQDTNAALAVENARLKTQVGVAKPSPAGTYVPPARNP
jgi:septal ring factor EnvC (AmiA/AmiB activator)